MMMDDSEFTEEDRAELERLELNYKSRWESVGPVGDAGRKSTSSSDQRFSPEQKAAWENPEMIRKQKDLKERARMVNSSDSCRKISDDLTLSKLDKNKTVDVCDEISSENAAESVRKFVEIDVELTTGSVKERRGSESDDAPISPRDLNNIRTNKTVENVRKVKKSAISDVVIERSEAQENVRTVPDKPKRQSKFRQNLRK